jgi:drug/metabolite transporter (DMT)-like permease
MRIMLRITLYRKLRLPLSREEMALVAVTMIWGGTFLAVQIGLSASGPLFFVAARFGVAALAMALLARLALRGLTGRELAAGAAIGATIFAGYAAQTIGLQTITSSQSAFITALYVPMVPLLQWVALGRRPRLASWGGIGLAFAGLVLLAGPGIGGLGFGRGEVLTLLGAVAIAGEIILIGRFAGEVDARRVTVVQLATASLLAAALMPMVGETVPDWSWRLVAIIVALGVASAVIQLTMNWAQNAVSPTRATLIYAGEPVWAAMVGRMAGERLPQLALVGGLLVVFGAVVSELRRQKPSSNGSSGASAAAAAICCASPGCVPSAVAPAGHLPSGVPPRAA